MRNRPTSNTNYVVILVFSALCASASTAAQTATCSLKFDQLKPAPELLGFHLGMTFDQAKARTPLVKLGAPDKFGVVKTSISPNYDPRSDRTGFADIRTVSLDFLDGELVTLWIGYEETFKWPTLDEFIEKLSPSLGVPASWPAKRNGRLLTCDGFSLFAAIIARGPSLRITNEVAQNTIAERREQAAELAEAEVIGDTRNKLYYPSDCSAKDDIPPLSRITFKNKDEAEGAGYKLAKECQ